MFGALEKVEDNILPDATLQKNNIGLIVDEVMGSDGNNIELISGEMVSFNKLVLTTGSQPLVLPPKV